MLKMTLGGDGIFRRLWTTRYKAKERRVTKFPSAFSRDEPKLMYFLGKFKCSVNLLVGSSLQGKGVYPFSNNHFASLLRVSPSTDSAPNNAKLAVGHGGGTVLGGRHCMGLPSSVRAICRY